YCPNCGDPFVERGVGLVPALWGQPRYREDIRLFGEGQRFMGRLRTLAGIFTTAGALAAVGMVTAPAAGAHTSRSGTFTVVADHLNNPRGLAPAFRGGLYLA